jgi:chromosome partitioning protein
MEDDVNQYALTHLPRPVTTIAVVNLKGGSSKTTTTAHLSAQWHGAGLRVLTVDADPQGSSLRWAEAAGWPWATIGLPVRTLHTQLGGLLGGHDVVVIDTPPLETQSGIVASALRAADLVIVPTAPTPIEVERLSAVRQALEDVAPLRLDGAPPPARVLLTRTVAGAVSTAVYRDALSQDGWTVLATSVPRLEALSQSYGDPIRPGAGPYAVVAAELLAVLGRVAA